MTASFRVMKRCPKRLTITVSHHIAEILSRQSTDQGRSISNLAAYLLEKAIADLDIGPPIKKRWPGEGR